MSKKLVSDLLVDYLERRGVTKLFGLCGHTVIGMLDALSRSEKIEYIGTRHESVASTAADGYARVTHKASVVMCHLGPGLTNVITGVANASLDSIPMVVIAGDVPSYYYGRHPHQEVQMHADGDQYKLLEPVVKRAWRVDDVEAFPDILDKAFRLAESGRPGPVLVDVPMDMFSREMDEDLWARTHKGNLVTMRPALDPAAAKAIAKRLARAKNPEAKIHVIDSKSASSGMALLVFRLAELCRQGLPFEQIVEQIEDYRKTVTLFFLIGSLETLVSAGRMNRAVGMMASMLNIHPICGEDGDGNIKVYQKVRGMTPALNRMIEMIGERGGTTGRHLVISQCNNQQDAELIRKACQRRYQFEKITMLDMRGLASFYAGDHGLIVAFDT